MKENKIRQLVCKTKMQEKEITYFFSKSFYDHLER